MVHRNLQTGWKALVFSDNPSFASALVSLLKSPGIDCCSAEVLPTADLRESQLTSTPEGRLILLHTEGSNTSIVHAVRDKTRCPLVVIGPLIDPHAMLDFMRAGADDYLDQAGDLNSEIFHLVRRLTSHAQDPARGKLLTVTSASGGTGCSVIAANLAVAIAKQVGACGLLDLDFGRGTLSAMLNVKKRHTLVDLCRHADKMDRAMVEQSFVRHETGVHLLAGPSHFADAECVTSRALDTVIQFSRSLFPFVVVDGLDPFHLTVLQEAIASDSLLVVTRLEFASLVNACRGIEHLAAHGVGGQALRIIVNRYGEAGQASHRDAADALGRCIAHFVPDAPKLINSSINVGKPVILEAPRATVSRALSAIAESQFQAGSKVIQPVLEV